MKRWVLTATILMPLAALANPARIAVEGYGFEVAKMQEDAVAFSNRAYTWQGVPQELLGWQFTRTAGGIHPSLRVTAQSAGDVCFAVALAGGNGTPDLAGWRAVRQLRFRYTATGGPTLRLFQRHLDAGESIDIPQLGWTGSIVLAPTLTASIVEPTPDHSKTPGVVIDYRPACTRDFIGCPAIVVLRAGTYIASHTFFGGGLNRGKLRLFRSNDAGKNWQVLSELSHIHFASLFLHREALHLMGVYKGGVAVLRSMDEGVTWTEPVDDQRGLVLPSTKAHSAAVPVVRHNGRLWRAMEDSQAGGGWPRHFRAFMMSAPEDADVLRADSWTCSNRLHSDAGWLDREFRGWLEGNAVVTPEGSIANILRIDSWEGGTAAVIQLSPDGRDATFDPATGFVDFPGGAKKFTIRFDPVSKLYWSLTNAVDELTRCGREAGGVRNNLTLIASPDLRSWKARRTVLSHPDSFDHGFQYVDWQFEGDDIIAVSRTSFDDGLGGARNHHDANYFTFHRVTGFRK